MMEEVYLISKNKVNGFDFSPWVQEKVEKTIRSLCYVSHAGLSEDDCDNLYYALSNSILLYAAVTGKNKMYDDKIIQFIFEKGIDAFDCTQYLFGLCYNKGIYIEKRNDLCTINQIIECITPDKANRTILHSLIAPIKHKNDWIKELEQDLEKVTMNECSWKQFYNKHKKDTYRIQPLLEDDVLQAIEYIISLG